MIKEKVTSTYSQFGVNVKCYTYVHGRRLIYSEHIINAKGHVNIGNGK